MTSASRAGRRHRRSGRADAAWTTCAVHLGDWRCDRGAAARHARPADAPSTYRAVAGDRRRRLRASTWSCTHDAARAAAGRRRLLAQGAGRGPGQPLLQPAAARGARHAARSRPSAAGARPGLARPRMERNAARPGGRGLGLDRHEPGRRQRADGVPAAAARRQRAVGRRQLPRRGRRGRAFGPDEVRFTPRRRWASPASQARYPVEWTVDTPAGRSPWARCSTRRNSTAAARPARSTGKA